MTQTIEYANLTNGLICAPFDARFTRLQSTHCEQRRWDDVITGVGVDLLTNLALGRRVIVHDQSERDRNTRATWQGLSWIRYATYRAWVSKFPPNEYSRSGMDVSDYWEERYQLLIKGGQAASLLQHLYPIARGADTDEIQLGGCSCSHQTWDHVDGSGVRHAYAESRLAYLNVGVRS